MEDNMSNIINNFKNILNNNSESNNSSNENTDGNTSSDFNITPEMIGNLASVFQNFSANQDPANYNSSQNFNTESNFGNSTDSNNFQNSSTTNKESSNSNFSGTIDFETILKIKSIMETLNKKDDPRSNLLYSLKPYLRENRQKKIDQYVNLLKITQVTDLFKKDKGDRK